MIAALVPAAGRSERMGRPKLILPIGGVPLIARVVAALRSGGPDPVVVVAPPPDAPGGAGAARPAGPAGPGERACAPTAQGGRVVFSPEPTADMRASVVLGLDHLASGP